MAELSETYKKSMFIGHYFNKYLANDLTKNWNGSEECATFAAMVLTTGNISAQRIDRVFKDIFTYGFKKIEDHMWDDYHRGFLAGQILGKLGTESFEKAKEAEELWNNDNGAHYGYYQEVLEEVLRNESS